jgi:hypothetical protein
MNEPATKADLALWTADLALALKKFESELTIRLGSMIAGWIVALAIVLCIQ